MFPGVSIIISMFQRCQADIFIDQKLIMTNTEYLTCENWHFQKNINGKLKVQILKSKVLI